MKPQLDAQAYDSRELSAVAHAAPSIETLSLAGDVALLFGLQNEATAQTKLFSKFDPTPLYVRLQSQHAVYIVEESRLVLSRLRDTVANQWVSQLTLNANLFGVVGWRYNSGANFRIQLLGNEGEVYSDSAFGPIPSRGNGNKSFASSLSPDLFEQIVGARIIIEYGTWLQE